MVKTGEADGRLLHVSPGSMTFGRCSHKSLTLYFYLGSIRSDSLPHSDQRLPKKKWDRIEEKKDENQLAKTARRGDFVDSGVAVLRLPGGAR